jgi:hypothetical protein
MTAAKIDTIQRKETSGPERLAMKYMLLIYIDKPLLDALPAGEFDTRMRQCLSHADELREEGKLLESQMLEEPSTAKSLRVRKGRQTIVDGPFAETKEVFAGLNVIEADSMDEAVRIASEFPWAKTGCIEVRPIRDIDSVRDRVGVARPAKSAVG